MKYIDADKLIAEIERLNNLNKQIAKEQGATDFIKGITAGYAEVLSLLDTLKEPVSDDLEEAAEEYASDYPAWNDEQAIAKYAFKRGAEWMAKQGVTFTAAVDHYEDFYLDSCDQEAEAIKKLGLKVMDWAIVQIRKK